VRRTHRVPRAPLAGLAGVAVAGATAVLTEKPVAATAGCRFDYTVSSSWPGGFGANVAVTKLGDPVGGWRLTWSFTTGQSITPLWNGSRSPANAPAATTR
jgi:non-reducing end alpha-L-arabinofuranosidase